VRHGAIASRRDRGRNLVSDPPILCGYYLYISMSYEAFV
jgi:hypothetical protein